MPSTKPDYPSETAYADAANLLCCEVAAIKAVAEVESGPLGAFLDSGEPVILFERHVFHRLTRGAFDGLIPDLSGDTPSKVYGPVSIQHHKLATAAQYNRPAALKSCSWGLFQIMGENHIRAGYPVLQDFVNAMYRSADDHLQAFVAFIQYDPRLLKAIREKDWEGFAFVYNGPRYARYRYHERIATAYGKLIGGQA